MEPGPLVVIVGETASGKSALAMMLAKKFNGEIICADSRTVYKDMDIGTAKPSMQDRQEVPHHLLDVVSPDEPFTVAQFKEAALKAIEDVSSRGKLPIMVGGSGLYIDAVLFDYGFSDDAAPRDPANPRHISKDAPRHRNTLRPNTLIIGLSVEKDVLRRKIEQRAREMLQHGLTEEVNAVRAKYPASKALQAPAYKAYIEYLDGALTDEEALARFIQNDLHLAKRQRTWFKRNKSIHWVDNPEKSVELVTTFLNKNP